MSSKSGKIELSLHHDGWKSRLPLAALLALALVLRLMLYAPDRNMSPDAVDYLNIARNFAEGRGFIHSIKWHFFTDDAVVRPAAGERPPLFPLIAGYIWKAGGRVAAIEILNVILGALAVACSYLVFLRAIGSTWIAFLSALLLACSPAAIRSSVMAWTEPLYLLLQALLLWLLLQSRSTENNHPEKAFRLAVAAGFTLAFAYLARPNAVAVGAAAGLWMLAEKRWRRLLAFAAPCAAVLALWWGIVWLQKGDPFYSVQQHHFRVLDIREGMQAGWRADLPTPAQFAEKHSLMALAIQSAWQYTRALFQVHFPGILLLGVLGIPFVWKRSGARLLSACAIFQFGLLAIGWATYEPDRLILPFVFCFAPLPVVGFFLMIDRLPARWRRPSESGHFAWAAMTAAVAVASLLLIGGPEGFCKQVRLLPRQRALPHPTEEIRKRMAAVPPSAVIATDAPFVVNWLFDRPSIFLPENLNERNAADFIDHYAINFVVVNPGRKQELSKAESLARAGWLRPLSGHMGYGLRWYIVLDG